MTSSFVSPCIKPPPLLIVKQRTNYLSVSGFQFHLRLLFVAQPDKSEILPDI